MKTVEVIPYILIDGIPTFRDSQVLALIDRAEKDGSLPAIFYGDSRYTKYDFLERVKHAGDVELHVILHGENTVGFVWIDQIQQKRGFGHYCVFSEYWGDPDLPDMAHQVFYELLKRFDVLIGVTQSWNRHAIAFGEKIGATVIGEIPGWFHDIKTDRPMSGMLYHFTKENLHGRK